MMLLRVGRVRVPLVKTRATFFPCNLSLILKAAAVEAAPAPSAS